jgi:hypothetical protein
MKAVNLRRITLSCAYVLMAYVCPNVHAQSRECLPGHSPGFWSKRATDLCTAVKGTVPDATRDMRIESPDGERAVHIVRDSWWVEVGSKRLDLAPGRAYVSYPAELAWSPNSRFFYITWSEGNIDGWITQVYEVGESDVREIPDVGRTVKEAFDQRHACFSVGVDGKRTTYEPNLGALTWLGDSSGLVIVAESIPDSRCDGQAGEFGGYIVSIPDGDILGRYSPNELVQRWRGALGNRLQGNYADLSPEQKRARP